MDPLTGELLDAFGGLADLERGVLRVTDPLTFVDDPLRVCRAAQLAARLRLELEPETEGLLRAMVARGDLDALPSERITEELRKLLRKSPAPSVGLEWLRGLGVVERFHPELAALVGCPQEPEWRPEGDVWTHTMMTIDAAALRGALASNDLARAALTPLVRGGELLELGYAPGPLVGRVLARIEQRRDRGEIETREEALRVAATLRGSDWSEGTPPARRKDGQT